MHGDLAPRRRAPRQRPAKGEEPSAGSERKRKRLRANACVARTSRMKGAGRMLSPDQYKALFVVFFSMGVFLSKSDNFSVKPGALQPPAWEVVTVEHWRHSSFIVPCSMEASHPGCQEEDRVSSGSFRESGGLLAKGRTLGTQPDFSSRGGKPSE